MLQKNAEAMERFLQHHDQRLLRIVVVAEDGDAQRRFRLRKYLDSAWRERQIFLRSGSPTSAEDLQRFGLPEAAAVVIPSDEFRFGDTGAADARAIKILMNLGVILNTQAISNGPAITAEVFDPRKKTAAIRVLQKNMEVVTGDAVIAQLLVQSTRDPRLVDVFTELLTYNDGCSPYVRAFPEFTGQHPIVLNDRFNKAIVLGATRMEEGVIERLEFDGLNSILLLASSRAKSAEESDSRTIVSYELLVSVFEKGFNSTADSPRITAEMAHVTSKLQSPRCNDLVLTRPRLLGYLQSHVLLRRELNSVFSALFMPSHGASITIHDIGDYRDHSGGDICFAELAEHATERGEVALGLLIKKDNAEHKVDLCPSSETACGEQMSLIVLTRHA